MAKRITIEKCIDVAKQKGGNCLSKKYKNCSEYLQWECKKGHVWPTSYNQIRKGAWCPDCAGNRKLTIDDCKKIAENKNGKCLSNIYENINSLLNWECELGHEWPATFASIKHLETWCPECSGNKPLTIEECQEVAKMRGGLCLSVKYKNRDEDLKWKCSAGHIWSAAFRSVKNNESWCPDCNISRSESLVRGIFEFVFEKKFDSIRPKWLMGLKNRCLELDGYCAELNLAFEFQGKQHYKSIYGDDALLKIKKNDALKLEKCYENNTELIIIDAEENINKLFEKTRNLLFELCNINIKYKSYMNKIKLFNKDNIIVTNSSEFDKIKKIAEERKYICISNIYIDSHTHLDFICPENHKIKMLPYEFKKGTSCGYCSGRYKYDIDYVKNLAFTNDVECLSIIYKNSKENLKFKCKLNHIWERSLSRIHKLNLWCKECIKISIMK